MRTSLSVVGWLQDEESKHSEDEPEPEPEPIPIPVKVNIVAVTPTVAPVHARAPALSLCIDAMGQVCNCLVRRSLLLVLSRGVRC